MDEDSSSGGELLSSSETGLWGAFGPELVGG